MAEDNKKYKDRLFNFIFGAEEIEITTIKEVMYLGMHNDVSFLMTD